MAEIITNCYIENNIAVGFKDELAKELIIPEGVTEIKERAFYQYYGLINVQLPNTLITINDNAFSRCSNLRRVTLPESVTAVKSSFLGGTFSECKQLIEVDFSKTKIEVIGESMFWRCKKLQKVKLPDTIVKIERTAFRDCTNLVSLELNEGLKIIECNFEDSLHLSILNIPKSVIHIEDLSDAEHIKTIMMSKSQYEMFKEYLPSKSKIIFKE